MPIPEPAPTLSQVIVCPSCSLILQPPRLQPNQVAICPRCSRQIHRYKRHPIQKGLALSLTGLLLYLPANLLPLLTFSVLGINSRSSILEACAHMFASGQYFVGTIVVLTTLVFPLLLLTSLLLVTVGLTRGRRSPFIPPLFRAYHHLGEWSMTDVFLVGVLITIIKMSHMASVSLNAGFFCLVGLVMTTVAAQTAIDPQLFWSMMEEIPHQPAVLPQSTDPTDYLLCHDCHKLLPADYRQTSGRSHCPRCGHILHQRKQNSITRTWALLLTAVVLTVPANLLPIMEVDYFGVPDRSTIMDGIIYFFKEGSYGIGLVIFIASILVPLFKVIGLVIILFSIHFRWRSSLRHKAVMFRFIEFIGRWSMLDIFVITLLCSLAQFGFLSSISAAPASYYFTGVVLSTMFAALSFDPRLLWDAARAAETK
ncbi:MAG: paraquat-inducible protein A [Desulfobulbus sp.]|nr:paraquat-inducible protein A [Desulfobulbus sp.]